MHDSKNLPFLNGVTLDGAVVFLDKMIDYAADRFFDRLQARQQAQQPRNEPPIETGTRQQAADLLKVSLPTVQSMINKGYIKSCKVGSRRLIDMSDLRAKIDTGEVSRYKHL